MSEIATGPDIMAAENAGKRDRIVGLLATATNHVFGDPV